MSRPLAHPPQAVHLLGLNQQEPKLLRFGFGEVVLVVVLVQDRLPHLSVVVVAGVLLEF